MARAKRKDNEYNPTRDIKSIKLPLYIRIWEAVWRTLYMVMSIATYLAMCFGFFVILYFAINSLVSGKYYTSIILGVVLVFSSIYINKHNPK